MLRLRLVDPIVRTFQPGAKRARRLRPDILLQQDRCLELTHSSRHERLRVPDWLGQSRIRERRVGEIKVRVNDLRGGYWRVSEHLGERGLAFVKEDSLLKVLPVIVWKSQSPPQI